MKSKIDTTPRPTVTMAFNLEGMYPRQEGDVITLEIPAFPFVGRILTNDAVETLEAAGVEERDIEDAVDDMLERLQTRLLAAMMMDRRTR